MALSAELHYSLPDYRDTVKKMYSFLQENADCRLAQAKHLTSLHPITVHPATFQ